MAQALFFEGPQRVAVREVATAAPGFGEVVVETAVSAVSAGTELLVYRGELPAGQPLDATIEALGSQETTYPLQYGYMSAGRIAAAGPGVDPGRVGEPVFAFQPHAGRFVVPLDALLPIPPDLSFEDAVFLPNMETAVSFLMDGRPIIGERVLVLGQGIVGLLTTALLARLPLAALVVADRYPRRREAARALGGTAALDPDDEAGLAAALGEADLTYELSGSPAALNIAIRHTGFDGRVVVGSWYGTKRAEIDLGGHFHRSHMRLISSQVSFLHPRWRGRWTKTRRLAVAWEMIRQIRPGRLITHRFPLTEAAAHYQLLDQQPEQALQTVFTYQETQPAKS